MKEPVAQQQRIVLLNHMRSRSSSRAKSEYEPPRLSGRELLSGIVGRCAKGVAIEFEGVTEDKGLSDEDRLAKGRGYGALRLRRIHFSKPTDTEPGYVTLLFELLDPDRRSFPVVDLNTFAGRELSAERSEVGSISAHVVVRLPALKEYDDGMYRCVIESASPITRSRIESFLCRQIKRLAPEWTFQVEVPGKKKPVQKTYHYTPRLELLADVSRLLPAASTSERMLSHLIFTKRSEKQAIGDRTHVIDRDVYGDVQVRIAAKQGPDDEAERVSWAAQLRSIYEARGYTTKIYFRGSQGGVLGGDVTNHQLDGAQDLLLCPREFIDQPVGHKAWTDHIDRKTVAAMRELLDKDGLWERTK